MDVPSPDSPSAFSDCSSGSPPGGGGGSPVENKGKRGRGWGGWGVG